MQLAPHRCSCCSQACDTFLPPHLPVGPLPVTAQASAGGATLRGVTGSRSPGSSRSWSRQGHSLLTRARSGARKGMEQVKSLWTCGRGCTGWNLLRRPLFLPVSEPHSPDMNHPGSGSVSSHPFPSSPHGPAPTTPSGQAPAPGSPGQAGGSGHALWAPESLPCTSPAHLPRPPRSACPRAHHAIPSTSRPIGPSVLQKGLGSGREEACVHLRVKHTEACDGRTGRAERRTQAFPFTQGL